MLQKAKAQNARNTNIAITGILQVMQIFLRALKHKLSRSLVNANARLRWLPQELLQFFYTCLLVIMHPTETELLKSLIHWTPQATNRPPPSTPASCCEDTQQKDHHEHWHEVITGKKALNAMRNPLLPKHADVVKQMFITFCTHSDLPTGLMYLADIYNFVSCKQPLERWEAPSWQMKMKTPSHRFQGWGGGLQISTATVPIAP